MDNMSGMKNFLMQNRKNKKQRFSEPCIECKRQGKNTLVYEPIVRCKNCGGALCRNHGSGLVMMGGSNPGGKCDTCAKFTNPNTFAGNPQQIPQQATAETLINRIKTAQVMINKEETDNAEEIINSVFKNLN